MLLCLTSEMKIATPKTLNNTQRIHFYVRMNDRSNIFLAQEALSTGVASKYILFVSSNDYGNATKAKHVAAEHSK